MLLHSVYLNVEECDDQRYDIVNSVLDKIGELSHLKYASNAVERCFTAADVLTRAIIVDKVSNLDAS